MDRMKSLSEAIRMLVEGEFSGYVKINFTQGSLGRVEKYEEINDAAIISAGEKTVRKKAGRRNSFTTVYRTAACDAAIDICCGCEADQ